MLIARHSLDQVLFGAGCRCVSVLFAAVTLISALYPVPGGPSFSGRNSYYATHILIGGQLRHEKTCQYTYVSPISAAVPSCGQQLQQNVFHSFKMFIMAECGVLEPMPHVFFRRIFIFAGELISI